MGTRSDDEGVRAEYPQPLITTQLNSSGTFLPLARVPEPTGKPPVKAPARTPARKQPQPPTGHQELTRYWVNQWSEKYKRPFPFGAGGNGSRHGKCIKFILESCGGALEDAKAVIDRFLSCGDGFFNGHPLAMLATPTQLPKFLVEQVSTTKGRINGHRSSKTSGREEHIEF
jgi:hypothetical protein